MASANPMQIESEIVAADSRRIDATIAADREGLSNILSDNLLYVHSSGREETKDVYIDKIATGHYDYRSFKITRRELKFHKDLVFDNGDSEVDIFVGDQIREIAGRYLMVWTNEGGQWRLLRFHSTTIPRQSAPK